MVYSAMRKFEYLRAEVPSLAELNQLGAQGWELVQVVPRPETQYVNGGDDEFFFKREVEQPSPSARARTVPEQIHALMKLADLTTEDLNYLLQSFRKKREVAANMGWSANATHWTERLAEVDRELRSRAFVPPDDVDI